MMFVLDITVNFMCKSRVYNSLTGIRTAHIHKNTSYISRVCAGSSAHALIILHYSLSNV